MLALRKEVIHFCLFKRKWIPISALGVFLFGSVQGQDGWCTNPHTKGKVGGVSWGSPSSPLLSPANPNKQLRWEGRVLKDRKRKPGVSSLTVQTSPGGASVLPLPLSLSFRENLLWGARRKEVHSWAVHAETQDPSPLPSQRQVELS